VGLFDMFLSEDKRIQKEQRGVTNRDAQPDDRELSARWLSENGSGRALVALLSRFEMKLDHQLNDRDEREFTYGLLAQHGDEVLRPLRVHLRKCKRIAMPLRLLGDLTDDETTVQMVYDLLVRELERDDFKPQKKVDLLVWLAERQHPGALEAAVPHLKDFDEAVRYGAAEVIVAQKDNAGQAPLESVLADPEEDSNRLRVRLAEVFIQRRWTLADPTAVAAMLPDMFVVRDSLIVANR
jgi:hypothetical protein